jgi:hypothetical protein
MFSIAGLQEVAQQLSEIADSQPKDPPRMCWWVGPFKAVHWVRADFWTRANHALASTHGGKLYDDDYCKPTLRGGKILRIPRTMLEEFRQRVDTEHGRDHTDVDPGAIADYA